MLQETFFAELFYFRYADSIIVVLLCIRHLRTAIKPLWGLNDCTFLVVLIGTRRSLKLLPKTGVLCPYCCLHDESLKANENL